MENGSQSRLGSSSLQHLGSVMTSPGTLPSNNLVGTKEAHSVYNMDKHFLNSTDKSSILDQTSDWEQSVSLVINELGVSSFPVKEWGTWSASSKKT